LRFAKWISGEFQRRSRLRDVAGHKLPEQGAAHNEPAAINREPVLGRPVALRHAEKLFTVGYGASGAVQVGKPELHLAKRQVRRCPWRRPVSENRCRAQ